LVDDLLGSWGDPAITGKPVRSDLRARKKSLPAVAALTARCDPARRLARLYLCPDPLGEAELEAAGSLIEQAGGRAWAQQEAERHLQAAMSCLHAARPAAERAGLLATLATLATRRDH
jgi:geranylgeranyl diphosphate synthase, type I